MLAPHRSYSRFGISSSSESSLSSPSKSSKFGLVAAPEFKLANMSCMLPKLPVSPPSSSGRRFKSKQIHYMKITGNYKYIDLPSSLSDSSSRHLLKSAFKKCGFFLSLVSDAQNGPDSAFFIVNSIQRDVFVVTFFGLILWRKFNVTSNCFVVSTELPLKYNVSSVNLCKEHWVIILRIFIRNESQYSNFQILLTWNQHLCIQRIRWHTKYRLSEPIALEVELLYIRK